MATTVDAMEIIYRDGTTVTVMPSHAAFSAAEGKACAENWNLNGFRQQLYAVYWELRHEHKTDETFDQWADKVVVSRQKTITLGVDPFGGQTADTEN